MLQLIVTVRSALHAGRSAMADALRTDRGEGVISAAIAVLIMAFLGAAMWVGFNAIWGDAEANIGDQVGRIGS